MNAQRKGVPQLLRRVAFWCAAAAVGAFFTGRAGAFDGGPLVREVVAD
jgi:hypothetical protein